MCVYICVCVLLISHRVWYISSPRLEPEPPASEAQRFTGLPGKSLYILDINPLLPVSFTNIFSHSLGCLFVLFMVSFAMQKLLSLIRSHSLGFKVY